MARKYFSSDDFASCADWEGWELRFSNFRFASQMSGSYVDYVKYRKILWKVEAGVLQVKKPLRNLAESQGNLGFSK